MTFKKIKEMIKKLYDKDPVFMITISTYSIIYIIGIIIGITTILSLLSAITAITVTHILINKGCNYILKKNYNKKIEILTANEEEINDYINDNDLKNIKLSKRTMKEINYQKLDDNTPLSINNIEEYRLKDLKTLQKLATEETKNTIAARRVKKRVLMIQKGNSI